MALILQPVTRTEDAVERKVMASFGQNSPPKSPTKSQSPQRLAAPVQADGPEEPGRRSVESIRIYADSDVYALLADVEEEINRMGDQTAQSEASHEAASNSGIMLNDATFSPQKPFGYSTAAF